MPSPSKPFATKQNQRQSDAKSLRGFMDRKAHNFSWPYTYPPFPSAPGWFSVNGVGYHPQFSSGGGARNMGMGMGMGMPIWIQPPDLRNMPSMTNSRQQPAFYTQEANGNASNSNENAAAAAATSPARSSPAAADNAHSNTTPHSALVPSRPTSPMTVDVAMQCLAGQLHDAIQLCTDCLKTHAEFVAKIHFTTVETRNRVWKDLLEHKFRSSGFLQDGFNNLGRRLGHYMDQAHCAAHNDPALASREQERRREAEGRVRRLRLLRAGCDEVVKLSAGASVDVLDCQEMLELMRDMTEKLSRKACGARVVNKSGQDQDKVDKKKKGNEGEGKQDSSFGETQSPELWAS